MLYDVISGYNNMQHAFCRIGGGQIRPGTFGKINVCLREYPKGPSVKQKLKFAATPVSADPICPLPKSIIVIIIIIMYLICIIVIIWITPIALRRRGGGAGADLLRVLEDELHHADHLLEMLLCNMIICDTILYDETSTTLYYDRILTMRYIKQSLLLVGNRAVVGVASGSPIRRNDNTRNIKPCNLIA